MKKIAILSALNERYGSGHYVKSKALLEIFQRRGVDSTLFVLSKYPYKKNGDEVHLKNVWQIPSLLEKNPADVLLVDKRENPKDFIRFMRQKGTRTLVLDSLGDDQKFADYVLNAIPHAQNAALANLSDPSYLPPLPSLEPKRDNFEISLFCGFIDKENLMFLWLRNFDLLIQSLGVKKIDRVNLFVGEGNSMNYYRKLKKLALCKFKNVPYTLFWKNPFFKEKIANSSLFLTYYGMSAIEAASFGAPMLLCNPSAYHEALSMKTFPEETLKKTPSNENLSGGCCDIGTKSLKKPFDVLDKNSIPTYEKLAEIAKERQKHFKETLKIGANFHKIPDIALGLLDFPLHLECKNCGSESLFVVYRTPNENFYQCPACSLIKKERVLKNSLVYEEEKIEYNESYFLEEYERSYKKTYEEDKENLYKVARERLKIVESYKKGKGKKTLLDIGCALGYFLDIAKEEFHFKTRGVEISAFAAKKASEKHKIFNGDVFDFNGFEETNKDGAQKKEERFDVVALWYVVEHFPDHKAIFRKINSLQKRGGILALSTPNAFGLSGRFNSNEFLRTSPQDHHYLYSEASLINILESYGYIFLERRSTGVHYSRFQALFPRLSKWIGPKLYAVVAKRLNLGDTFEIYFKKLK